MTPYLIQRAKFKNRDWKEGIDSILSFDYMGSSEFEWGALPKSLQAIRADKENYDLMKFHVKGKPITVFAPTSMVDEIQEYLDGLATRKFRLKEFSAFNDYINGDAFYSSRFDLWWDIDNHLMFWGENDEHEKLLMEKL